MTIETFLDFVVVGAIVWICAPIPFLIHKLIQEMRNDD